MFVKTAWNMGCILSRDLYLYVWMETDDSYIHVYINSERKRDSDTFSSLVTIPQFSVCVCVLMVVIPRIF